MAISTKLALFQGVCGFALAVGIAAPALAQSQEEVPAQSTTLDEIVVTATRTETRLSKVPLSITAMSQETMDRRGIRDIKDLAAQTPGVDIPAGRVQRVAIRGIDSSAGAATSAVYIDDTPIQARNAAINYSGSTVPYIFDLERVEVLRGPQGTLFGSSAQGGAIRFITPTPSLSNRSAYGRAQVNLTEDGEAGYEFGFAYGAPIIEDVLGFRASVYQSHAGGWIDRQSWQNPADREEDANGIDTTVVRVGLNWKPTDWLTIAPSIYYQNVEQGDRGPLYTRCPSTVTLNPTINPCPMGVSDPDNGKFLNYASLAATGEDEFYVPSLKINLDGENLSFTSVTSGLSRKVKQINDATYNNDRVSLGNAWLFPIVPNWAEAITWQAPETEQKLFSQELRLTNAASGARLRWTLGAYYSKSELTSNTPIASPHYPDAYLAARGSLLPARGFMVDGKYRYYGNEFTEETSKALFANIDFSILENLTLSAGVRQNWDELTYDIVERGVSYAGGVATAAGSMKEEPFTPRVALSWEPTDTSLFYASWAQGYRSGGVNKAVPDICENDLKTLGISGGGSYASDTTDSYELGWKGSLFERRLSVQASVYHTTWDDIQQQIRLPCAFSMVANTASAVSKGVDLNLNWRATDALTLSAAIGYTNAEYQDTIIIGTSPLVYEGQTLGPSPWTVNLGVDYQFTAFGGRDAYFVGRYNYREANTGPFAYQFSNSSLYDPTRVDGNNVNKLDLRAGVQLTETLTGEVFVENALNNVDLLYEEPTYIRGPLWFGETQRPRLFGMQLIARY